MNKQMHAVLHALEAEPHPVPAIAKKARVSEEDAANALRQLAAHNLAIAEDTGYELTGPLSWFGSFDAAVRYNAKKRFIVSVSGDPQTHLYVDDVRVKGERKAGDPGNETVSVFACGRTALEVKPAFADEAPTCAECRSAFG
jgi:hypothetical protein